MTGPRISKSVLILLLLVYAATPGIVAAGQEYVPGFRRILIIRQTPSEKLSANIARLMTLTEMVPRLKPATDSAPEQQEKVIASVEYIIRTLDFLRQDIGAKKLIMSDEALAQLNGFAQLVISILIGLDQSDSKLTAAHQKSIESIESDLNLRMSRIDESRGTSTGPMTYPGVRIVVRTLKSDGAPETNLRIYYLGAAYFDTEFAKDNLKTFDRLSSPSDREIPEGYYRLWAGRGNDPTPVSDVKSLQAIKPSNGAEIAVDLLIIK